jgi:hypothetical protein
MSEFGFSPNFDPPLPPVWVDPSDPESIARKIEEIHAEDSWLANKADGDADYLRFLQADAVATLDVLVHPDKGDVRDQLNRARGVLNAYEQHKFGTSGP